ncbi:MAG: aminotransferase class III [Lentisphaerae bacterium RIFOXYB12_FULL_65_16]|nr:MAG: aminotransferase class III [Lentisphaerae bacterium RIFOXYA12_64_32]OGV87236.1 MAG: aminotransferase class III [Lentisphaerae bacterium RIFOXYB12_FULL_65_16]
MSASRFPLVPSEVPRVETKHRRIVTAIPVPQALPVLETLARCESVAMHGQLPVVWDTAEGFQVRDVWGNQWIDFTSTIFVANAGHANPRIVAALRRVLDKPLLHAYNYGTAIRAEYLQYLIDHTPAQFEKACLFSAGTEATEAALRLMRLHAAKTGKRRPGIVALEGCFHGETLGARMLGHNPAKKRWVGYLDPNIHHIPFPYPWREQAVRQPAAFFEATMAELLAREGLDPQADLAGFMLETFQGWAAAFYPPDYVHALHTFARRHGMLITFDEMQAGFGRTGRLFGYMHYGIEPDLMCCGKGASSSVPLSLILGPTSVLDLPEHGDMYSTHSANPMACAAGLANLQALLDDGLIENAARLGAVFHAKLEALQERYPCLISRVCGKGLIAAVIFTDPAGAPLAPLCDRIAELAMQRGLLVVHTGRESIKLAPPLCITEEALTEGIDVLESCVRDLTGG